MRQPSVSGPRPGSTPAGRLYGVLADDLTGASDVGLQFVAAGLRTGVRFGVWSADDTAGLDVVVVDTATRNLPAAAAFAGALAAYRRVQAAGAVLVFKKIDSTVRGNLGSELDALLSAGGFRRAIVCPAFPAQARTLAGGVLRVDGVPVAESAAGRDPVMPVVESYLPALLAAQTAQPVRHLPLPIVAAGTVAVAHALELHGQPGELVVCDAVTDSDLATLVDAAAMTAGASLLVGSAGLAQPVAQRLASRERPQVLVVCGSLHPVARRQAAALAPASRHIELDMAAARSGGTDWEQWLAALYQQLVAGEGPGETLLLTTPETVGTDAGTYAIRLAEAACTVVAARPIAGVVVTGGDTLRSLLDAWKAKGIDIAAGLAPGIPIGRIRGGAMAGLPIVTKAGGFGGPEVLVAAVRALTNRGEI